MTFSVKTPWLLLEMLQAPTALLTVFASKANTLYDSIVAIGFVFNNCFAPCFTANLVQNYTQYMTNPTIVYPVKMEYG
jgi:hypothetical protein